MRCLYSVILVAMLLVDVGATLAAVGGAQDVLAIPVKYENPDIEVSATLCPDTLFGNPFEMERFYTFRRGEPVRLCLTINNLEGSARVPLRRGLVTWYEDLQMAITVQEAGEPAQPIPALIAVAREVVAGKGKSEEFLSPRSSSVAYFQVQLPDLRSVSKSKRVLVAIECHVDFTRLGMLIPKLSGKTVGGVKFQVQLESSEKDEDILAYRRAGTVMLDGDPEGALRTFEALAEKYPDEVNIQGMMARCYHQAGKLQEAMDTYKALLKKLKQAGAKNGLDADLRDSMISAVNERIRSLEGEIAVKKGKGELR